LYARYVQHLRRILLDDLRFSDRDILVLGAGGFTLSHREPLNRYTYVDIDPAIRAIAERDFLREPARGEFIATDARRFVIDTTRRFDAIVVDVYSSRTSIPGHLVTREFWRDTRRALKPGGVMLANLILDGQLASPYARNLLATIESAYGRCAVEVLAKSAPAATSSSPASPWRAAKRPDLRRRTQPGRHRQRALALASASAAAPYRRRRLLRPLAAGYGHALDQDGTDLLRAAHFDVIADGGDAAQHLAQVAGDGDFLHRIGDLALFHPVARGAARIVAGDVIHALAEQLGDQQAPYPFRAAAP
jgi:hypothetical protein